MLFKQANIGSNKILNLLPEDNRIELIDMGEVVNLNLAEVIADTGHVIDYVYFPIEGIISWEKKIPDSPYLVIALIGNEGVLFPTVILGENFTPCRAVVQKAGFALRIASADFIWQIEHHLALRILLKRYIFVVYSQLLQTAACNLFHVLESRLAKLLLTFKDRSQLDELQITQELLSQMLGVRRVGVTKAASSLQRNNLISYRRGNVTIHDTKGLKAAACLCYQADIDTYAQFLKAPEGTLTIEPDNDKVFI